MGEKWFLDNLILLVSFEDLDRKELLINSCYFFIEKKVKDILFLIVCYVSIIKLI